MLPEIEQNWETLQSIREVLSSFSQDGLLLKLKKRVNVLPEEFNKYQKYVRGPSDYFHFY